MKRKDLFKILISLGVTLILLYILISQITLSDILEILKKIPLTYLLLGFLVYLCFNVFRTLRFQLLLNKKLSFRELMPIILVHGFLLNVLPVRTGEFSYLYLLKKKKIPLREAVSSLVVARAFDGIALSSLFIFSVFMLGAAVPAAISNAFTIISLFLFLIILFLVVIFYYSSKGAEMGKKFLKKTKLGNFNLVQFLAKKIFSLVKGLQEINLKEKILGLLFYSFGIWICGYYVYVILMEAIGIHLNLWAIFTGATFVVFATLLPVQGIAGFGTIEGTWTVVFLLLGVEKELAITSGFGFHIVRLTYATILGVISLLILKFRNERRKDH